MNYFFILLLIRFQVLIGNAGVGKTCLVRRFTQVKAAHSFNSNILPHFKMNFIFTIKGIFPPGQGATIGVDFMIKTVDIDGLKIKVNIHLLNFFNP